MARSIATSRPLPVSRPARPSRAALALIIAAGAVSLTGCSSAPQSFATPEEAVDTLVGAMRDNDSKELERILGSDSEALLDSGDKIADANGRATFVRLYDEKHALTPIDPETVSLSVGASDWPSPIPLVNGEKGWYFDTIAGLDEVLSRRIGRNELFAIQVCLAIADAEREYASADYSGNGWREYARTFTCDPGKKNGLYWPAAPGQPESPLGALLAEASAEGYSGPRDTAVDTSRPYHGYQYRLLTAQGPDAPGGAMDFVAQGHMIGGFGVIAWPVEYANSGLKSFIISHHGVLYEKDLGDDTERIATSVRAFNPDAGWEKADTSDQ